MDKPLTKEAIAIKILDAKLEKHSDPDTIGGRLSDILKAVEGVPAGDNKDVLKALSELSAEVADLSNKLEKTVKFVDKFSKYFPYLITAMGVASDQGGVEVLDNEVG